MGYIFMLQQAVLVWIAMQMQRFIAEHQRIRNGFKVQCIILIHLLILNCSP